MKKVITLKTIPDKSLVLDEFGNVDYYDAYQVIKSTDKNIKEILNEIMKMPKWVDILLRLRNIIVGVFGLKTEKNAPKSETFFTLIKEREDEVVIGEEDKHLNFRSSVIVDKSEGTITLTTVVHFNNIWGNFYFSFVKPFHKRIMKSLMRNYLKK
jgi:hypothetical protein